MFVGFQDDQFQVGNKSCVFAVLLCFIRFSLFLRSQQAVECRFGRQRFVSLIFHKFDVFNVACCQLREVRL